MDKKQIGAIKINKVKVEVDKIRSYQTLVYKNGNSTFAKPEYREYHRLISLQIAKLKRIEHKKDLEVSIHFNCRNRVVGDLDNITKPILDTLQRNNKIYDDRYITKLNLSKSFGHKGNSIEIEISELENEDN